MEALGQLATRQADSAVSGFTAVPGRFGLRVTPMSSAAPLATFGTPANGGRTGGAALRLAVASADPELPQETPLGSRTLGSPKEPLPLLRDCSEALLALAATAAEDITLMNGSEAGHYSGVVEDIARTVEYLQVVAAGLVNRIRQEANADSTAGTSATGPASAEYRNSAEYMRASLRVSAGEARRRLSLAETVLPRTGLTGQPVPPAREELAAAMACGAVSSKAATQVVLTLEHVRHLCDAETLGRIERSLTRTAVENDPDFLARVAKRWTDTVDQDGGEPSEEYLRHRQGAFLRRPRNGLQHLEVFATTEQFEHLVTVMNNATNPRLRGTPGSEANDAHDSGPANSQDEGAGGISGSGGDSYGAGGRKSVDAADGPEVPASLDRRTRAQRMLDGLVGACKVAMSSGSLPAAGGLRPQVLVTIGYKQLLTDLEGRRGSGTSGATGLFASHHDAGSGTFAFTGPVSAGSIRKMACDADLLPVVLGGADEILDIGRASRVFPPHIRKAITARDQGCAFPGCTMPAPWCEAHHIEYWSHGGATSTDNGTLLCSHHHHLVHKEEWRINVEDGVPWFIPPPHIDLKRTPQRNRYFRMRQ